MRVPNWNPERQRLHGEWTWCLICQRVHRTLFWIGEDWRCPADGCAGKAVDAIPWDDLTFGPRGRHPEYPSAPEEGSVYQKW